MTLLRHAFFGILALLLLSKASFAQKAAQTRIIARAENTGAIRLRWSATNAMAWKYSNQHGFKLERYTVLRDKQRLTKPEYRLISNSIIKAKPLDQWKELAGQDNYAAIIAQALYGKDFQLTSSANKGAAKMIAQSRELEQRFSFAVYAADMSFDAAVLAGWGIIDHDTKANEKYLYRLSTAAPAHVLKPDTCSVFISPKEHEPLPIVKDVFAKFGDRSVRLSWDFGKLTKHYVSYFIEKSTDQGKTFHRLKGAPISDLNAQEDKTSTKMYFTDSITNHVEYQYRVRGINSFGEVGPNSKAIIGQGREQLPYAPAMKSSFIDDSGILQLKWTFEEEGNHLLKGFVIHRSDKIDGRYELFSDTLANTTRSLSAKKSLVNSNYFTVTAIPHYGEARASFPSLVQAIDTIPPAIPTGLKAVIDTCGVVTLSWDKNTEKDFNGYKIYRALKAEEDLVPLTDDISLNNTFEDQIELNMLNKKVWYGVSALDKRFNQSAVSPLIEVRKPSKIPPSPPVFTKYAIQGDTLMLNWINSSDDDIVTHSLHRKAAGDSAATKVLEYPIRTQTTYADTGLQAGTDYTYYLQAKNESGITSNSEPLEIATPASAGPAKEITRFYAQAQPNEKRIQLVWDDQLIEVVEYQLYRAINDQALLSWRFVAFPNKALYDTDVKMGTSYTYGIRAVLQSGGFSSIKKVTVKY